MVLRTQFQIGWGGEEQLDKGCIFFFEITEWIKITAFKKIHFCVLIIIWCLFLTASLLQLIVFNVVLSPVRWFSDAETFWLKKSNQVIVDFIWITLSPLPYSPFQVTDVKSLNLNPLHRSIYVFFIIILM